MGSNQVRAGCEALSWDKNASLCLQLGLGEAPSLRWDCELGGAIVGTLPQVDFLMICFISGASYNNYAMKTC